MRIQAVSPALQASFKQRTYSSIALLLLTRVSSLALGFVAESDASSGVDHGGLLDDQTIAVQSSNVTTGVGQGNFVDFVGVQPNLALSALEDGSGEALLQTKIDCHFEQKKNTKR